MNPFVELLERLAHAEVRFVLVGGVAVLLHGHSRTTQDVDVLVEGAGAELRVDELAVPQAGALRVIEEIPLDIFTLMRARGAGHDFAYEDLAAEATVCQLPDGSTVLVAAIPRLLEIKAGTGRFKDRLDTDALEEIWRGARAKRPTDLTTLELGPTTDSSNDQGNWPSSPDTKP